MSRGQRRGRGRSRPEPRPAPPRRPRTTRRRWSVPSPPRHRPRARPAVGGSAGSRPVSARSNPVGSPSAARRPVDLRPDLEPLAVEEARRPVSSVMREVRGPGRPGTRRARRGRSRTRSRSDARRRRRRRGGGRCSTTTRSAGRAGRRRAAGRSAAGRRSRRGVAVGGGGGRPWRGRVGEDRPAAVDAAATATRRAQRRAPASRAGGPTRPRRSRRPPGRLRSASDAGRRFAMTRSSRAGIHQFQRPSRRIVAGTSRARTTVASRATAMATPRPSALMSTMSANANDPATTTTISAADGHDPAAALQAAGDGLAVVAGPVPDLLHPRQQEDLVVHRQPEQDAEQDHRLASSRRTRAAGTRAAPRGCRPGRSRPGPRSWP